MMASFDSFDMGPYHLSKIQKKALWKKMLTRSLKPVVMTANPESVLFKRFRPLAPILGLKNASLKI